MPLIQPHPPTGPYSLPPLKFGFNDLEPVIGGDDLRRHHAEIHAGCVNRLNDCLSVHPSWLGLTIEELVRRLSSVPEDIRAEVRYFGGGHANHQFFWKILSPAGGNGPSGDLALALAAEFGSVDQFRRRFEALGAQLFGSGWIFLVCLPEQKFKLEIVVLANNDSVLNLPSPSYGILVCDLWEHAYYGRYRHRRADWLRTWWDIVDWDYVGQRLQGVHEGRRHL